MWKHSELIIYSSIYSSFYSKLQSDKSSSSFSAGGSPHALLKAQLLLYHHQHAHPVQYGGQGHHSPGKVHRLRGQLPGGHGPCPEHNRAAEQQNHVHERTLCHPLHLPGQYHLHVHHRDRKNDILLLHQRWPPNPPPNSQEFERGRAFIFLEEIARQFVAEYGLTVATAIAYGMNSEFSQVLAMEMRRFNEVGNSSIMHQVHGQIDELKNIMVQNIDNVTARGERIELLVNKTENLRNSVRNYNCNWSQKPVK